MRRAWLLILAASCGGGQHGARARPIPTEGVEVAIYTSGDPRGPLDATPPPIGMTGVMEMRISLPEPPPPPPVVPPPAPPPQSSGLVVDRRFLDLAAGVGQIRFDAVARTLLPSSVWLQSITAPDQVVVRSRAFEPAESAAARLMTDSLGRRVELETASGRIEGTLLAVTDSDLVVRDLAGAVRAVPRRRGLRSVGLPSGRGHGAPGLYAELEVAAAGRHLVELAYAATGLSWWIDYSIDASGPPTATALVVDARATIDNQSGLERARARVSLFTGLLGSPAERPLKVWSGDVDRFASGRRQVEVLHRRPGRGILEYQYRGAVPDLSNPDTEQAFGTQSQGAVDRYLVFANPRDGTVFAPGRALVSYRARPDAPLVRFATTLDKRVAPGETVKLKLDGASGLTGERRQLYVERSPDGKRVLERYELSVRNTGDTAAKVRIIEPLARSGDVTVRRAKPRPERIDRELDFTVDVPAGGTAKAYFEAVYRW